jgi:hypothetical protein
MRHMHRPLAVLSVALSATVFVVVIGTGVRATVAVQPLGYCGGDDWEPTVAAGASGHVYVLITHYKGDTTCDPASGLNESRIMIQGSDDRGRTFSPPRVVSDAPGGIAYPSQADPSIAVDQSTGAVYVSFLAYGISGGHTDVYVAKSTDAGATFPQVVKANAKNFQGIKGCKNCDHEKILARAGDVYLAYGRAQYHFLAVSTDGAKSFTQHTVDTTDVVTFAEAAAFDPAGNAWFAWGDCQSSNCTGTPAVDYRVSETLAGTATTTFSPVIAQSPQGPPCPFSSCGFAYFGGQDAIAIDAAGTVYLAWQDGQVHSERASPPIIMLSRCQANCLAASGWSLVGRIDDKAGSGCPDSSCYALFPNLVAGARGEVSATWMDDRNDALDEVVDHSDGWNLWYRTSTNGGITWTSSGQRISVFDPSQTQSEPDGFLFPYGDYTGLALNPSCRNQPVMVWGEGHDWLGGPSAPGHIEYASFCS